MDRSTATFVDGPSAAAATSGILRQLQGRIFALLYLQPRPIALEDIAAELEQSTEATKTTTTTLLGEIPPEFDVEVFSERLRRDFLRKIVRNSEGSS